MNIHKTIDVQIQVDSLGKIPKYAHPGDAGCDLAAALSSSVLIYPGERKLIPTGLRVAIPDGYELQIRSRSGMTLKHGMVVANSPGTIDSSFRGEVGVILHNLGQKAFQVDPGMLIAQGVFAPVMYPRFELVDTMDETTRGSGGFGSTGL